MKLSERLNSINFTPSKESGDFSVLFHYNGRIRERRFNTQEEADSFSKGWDNSEVCFQPLYLRLKSNGDIEEYK